MNILTPSPDLSVVYERVSTDHQDNSMEVQKALNSEYCTRFSLATLCEAYSDPDTSGSIPFMERNGSRALMNRLKLGDIKHIVTTKQDRLGRDTLDQIATIRAIWEMGITPHFTSEGGAIPRTPQNELLFEIKASVAQYERNLIRDRTRAVLRHKFNEGELVGNVPFGFDCVYTFQDGHKHTSASALRLKVSKVRGTNGGMVEAPPDPEALSLMQAHGPVVDKTLVPNPKEQEIIRLMANLRRQGVALKNIACHLNQLGHVTKLGRAWQVGTVDSVLRSRHTQRLLGYDPMVQTPALEQAA